MNNMTVGECVDIMKRYGLPAEDFLGWSDGEKAALCKHYYNELDNPIYDFNPYTQGYMLCESLGLPKEVWDKKLRSIKEKFEMYFEDDIKELTSCCWDFL